MECIKKIIRKIDFIEEFLSGFCIFLIPTLLFTQLFLRMFNVGFAWFEEVLRFSFLFLVYSASVIGVKSDAHFSLTFLVNKLPLKFRKYTEAIKYAVWYVLNLIVIYQSILYVQKLIVRPQTSPVLEINMAWVYVIIPVMFILQTIRMTQFIINRIRRIG